VNSLRSQVAEQGRTQSHQRPRSQIQIPPPPDFNTETPFAPAPESTGTDCDERPNPISQPDMSSGFEVPHPVSVATTENIFRMPRGWANQYEYCPLESSNGVKIRRLRIEPGIADAPIVCSLIPSSLNEPYEALSYVWGTEEPTMEIRIEETMPCVIPSRPNALHRIRETSFYVRPNLYAALENFRSRKNHVDLWIDALCIDQMTRKKRFKLP
jgi:hypothetical protein